jgi:phosphohistidine phosphatase SixA
MMKTISRSVFCCLLVISVISCSEKKPEISFDGQMIKEIKSNIVYTMTGDSIILQEDSIVKIYYLIRHAEKDTTIKEDPPLTKSGLLRSTKLADILRGTRIDAIYSTLTTRTMFTVDSLADIKAMRILPYENKSLKDLIFQIEQSTSVNRIFIVGHSNTIPSLTNTLAKKDIFKKVFDESVYDNFVIVVEKKSGSCDVYQLKY